MGMMRGGCFLLAGILLLRGAAVAAEKPWAEVDSPHFRVMSNGGEHEAQHVAYEFELMRATLADRFPGARMETGAPVLIFAVSGEDTAMQLAPWMQKEKQKGILVGGFFEPHWEKKFAMVRLDTYGPQTDQIIYHEYTHAVLHANFRWLPMWLDEGTAEFFSNTRFDHGKIYIGDPSPRARLLKQHTLIPIETLLTTRSLRDGDEAGIFYAEAWAFVHFLSFGPAMQNGAKLHQFEVLLQKGMEQKAAFNTVFGAPASLEESFREYAQQFAFPVGSLNNPPALDEKSFQVRKLSAAETDALLASYGLWSQHAQEADPLIEKAIAEDPNLGLAHEDQGFLNFMQGKDAEAEASFAKAFELDPSLYLSLYYKTMLSPAARSEAPADEASLREAMEKTLKINPEFAPAWIELAILNLRQGRNVEAIAAAVSAEKLEPSRAGYHLLTGRILLRLGRGKDASDFARFVAERWNGPDRDEAVGLWNEVPAAERAPGDPLTEETPKETQTMEGTVHAINCEKGHELEVVVARGSELLTFRANGPYRAGFSDTLWYGTDHFNQCHHLEGMRVVVRYKPPLDKNETGDLAEVEYLEDLPQAPPAKVVTAAAQAVK